MVVLSSQDHRNSHKAAFGKKYIGFIFFYEFPCLSVSFQDAEGVRKVFKIKITAQLSGRNSIIGNSCVFDQLPFNSVVRADIADVISGFFQGRDQSQIWSNMTSGAAAGEYNGFHKSLPPWIFHAH